MRNRPNRHKAERGGLLFSEPKIGDHIVISEASQPTCMDRSGRFFFIPDLHTSQNEIERQFEQGLAYIGDWHTHPTKFPKPSHKDISTIKSIFHESEHYVDYILMLIIGTGGDFRDSFLCLTDGCTLYQMSSVN
jgi:integrative and conjugative element protein (TIGR02256 family)